MPNKGTSKVQISPIVSPNRIDAVMLFSEMEPVLLCLDDIPKKQKVKDLR